MYIFDTCVFVTICIMCRVCVRCQLAKRDADSEAEEETLPEDHYSFIALIDIVFTNGAKKTCTGTIIHDNVVITAAHCFYIAGNDQIQPELTASFIVIGTKKMFDTGYEQYLPIERVITHPRYEGWTADLALVRTFAGMVSDKPGQVVPLATERTSTPVDSDVIVFSWGQCKDNENQKKITLFFPVKETTNSYGSFEEQSHQAYPEKPQKKTSENKRIGRHRRKKLKRFRLKNNRNRQKVERIPVTRAREHSWISKLNKFDKPMSSIEENNRYKYDDQQRYENLTDFNSDVEQRSWENKLEKLNQLYERSEVNKDRMIQRDRRQTGRTKSYYKNGWRRKMGDQQNKLTIEIFGLINTHACQKMLQKAMPTLYRIKKRQEILCYTSERRYITEEDAGAPAMRHGRLVAVTLGSANFEGDHIAVGLKMVCFCSWIAANLPKGGSRLQCCKNCCDANSEERDTRKPSHRHSHKKRKLEK